MHINGGDLWSSDSDFISIVAIQQYHPVSENILQSLLLSIKERDRAFSMASMNIFLEEIVLKKERSLKLLNTLQVIAAALIVLLYFMVMLQLILRLSKIEVVEVQSQKETAGIMNAISESLFLLDNKFEVGSEQPASLRRIFKSKKELSGNFLGFIST